MWLVLQILAEHYSTKCTKINSDQYKEHLDGKIQL